MRWLMFPACVVFRWAVVVLTYGALVHTLLGCVAINTSISAPQELVTYQRAGGLNGNDDRLAINVDATATLTRSKNQSTFTLNRNVIQQLQQALDQANFSQLNTEYLPKNTCCDLIEYTITYGGHTVRTKDTAIPDVLYPAMDLLDQIIESGGNP